MDIAIQRGNVVLVAGGVYATKPRPAVIVQDDAFDATDSVTVCPFTTTPVDAPLLRLPIIDDATTGLDVPNFAMIDKITPVRRTNISTRIGSIDSTSMIELERRITTFLGLAR